MIVGSAPIIADAGYRARGVAFTTSDYLTRSSAFSSIVDNSLGTYSFWARIPSGDSSADSRWFFSWERSSTGRRILSCSLDNSSLNDNCIRSPGSSASSTLFQAATTTPQVLAGAAWRHIICSFQFHNIRLYLDGSLIFSSTSVPDSGNYGYTVADDLHIARRGTSGIPAGNMAVELADFYFDNSFIDLSNAANMAKFRDAVTGKPVALGADGSGPTGSQPVCFLSGPASSFNINRGYGGDFTVTGSPTDASTSPSD